MFIFELIVPDILSLCKMEAVGDGVASPTDTNKTDSDIGGTVSLIMDVPVYQSSSY